MKINSLLESQTVSSAISNTTSSAPEFGRDDDKLEETTTSGAMASDATAMGGMQRRSKGSMLKGIKTSSKFPNSKTVKEAEFNRGGHNSLKDKKDYLDKREHLHSLLDTPGLNKDDRDVIRQRLQDLEASARKAGLSEAQQAPDEWEEDTEKRERFLQYAKQKLIAAKKNNQNITQMALALSAQDNKYFGSPFINNPNVNNSVGFGSVTVGPREAKYTDAIARIVDWLDSSQGIAQVAAQQAAVWLQPHGKEFLERVYNDLLGMQDTTGEARAKHAVALSGYQVEHLGGRVRGSFKGLYSNDPADNMTPEVYDILSVVELEIARIKNQQLYEKDIAERKKIWDSIPMPIKQTLAAEHGMNPQQFEAMLFGETDADKIAGYYNNQRQEQPEREKAVAEGNKFLQQHGIGVQNGKFPEPRKPRPDGIMSKSEVLGKDGLVYHWQDPRAKQSDTPQGVGEAKKANTKTARKEFGKRPRAELSDKEKEQKKSDSDRLWDMLQAHIAQAEKEKQEKLDEVNPQNFDSDEDYYDAVEADDLDLDKFGNGWDIPDEIAVLRNQLRHTTSQYARAQIENKIKRYEDIYYGEDSLEEASKSQAQFRTMAAVAHNPKFAKKVGISQKVGKEFHGADKKQDYKDLPAKVDEEGKGLWANIHAKRERIKSGSGERMRKPGSKGAPTAQNFKDAANEAANPAQQAAIAIAKKKKAQGVDEEKQRLDPKCWTGYKKQGTKMKGDTRVNNCVPIEEAEFTEDKIANQLYQDLQIFKKGVDKDIGSKAKDKDISSKAKDRDIIAKEGFDGEYDDEAGMSTSNLLTTARAVKGLIDTIDDRDNLPEWVQEKIAKAEQMLVTSWDYLLSQKEQGIDPELAEDWQKVNKRDNTDGMSKKAVKAYRRENPGSKLKTAVTTKPSKLKKGSKAAKRRKSFCARMSGMKKAHASAKTKRDPDSPINKALRRWNCESVEQLQELVMIAEQKIKGMKK